jgi:proteasome lid subunit RPN8/RPN11
MKMNKSTMKAQSPQAAATEPTAHPAKPEQKQPQKQSPPPRRPVIQRPSPVLRFSPTAWAKLLYFRDRQETEIGGFAVTAAEDLLRVEEFVAVKQDVSVASVSFDDQAVADFFEAQVDAGRKPERFARIWLHTHPGGSPQPSATDEETFARVFGSCQWALMFVLARGGKTYARMRFNVGPGGNIVIPVEVDFAASFGPSQRDAWEAEYKANINAGQWSLLDAREDLGRDLGRDFGAPSDLTRRSVPDDWLEELEAMEPAERQLVLDELAGRPDLWGDREEVSYECF